MLPLVHFKHEFDMLPIHVADLNYVSAQNGNFLMLVKDNFAISYRAALKYLTS